MLFNQNDRIIAKRAAGNPAALVFIIRSITPEGVFISREAGYTSGFPSNHLLSVTEVAKEYVAAPVPSCA
jgi:hypothetical protein